MWKHAVCRACEGFKNLISIFNDEDNTISSKLMTCAMIQVSHNDGLPQHICSPCIKDLNTAFEFKTRCEELDNKFRQAVTVDITKKVDPLLMEIEDLRDNSSSVGLKSIRDEKEDNINKEQSLEDNFSRITKKRLQTMKARVKINNENKTNKLVKEPYKCTGCDDIFETYANMIKHKKVHGDKGFRCSICKVRWFKSSHKMKLHQNVHKKVDESESFTCEICGKSYVYQTSLWRHIRFHNNDKRYECEICKKTFFQSDTLKDHKITHMLNKDFQCKDCTKAFKTQKYLDKHREVVHQVFIQMDSFPCAICGRILTTERKRQWHIKQHTQTSEGIATNVPECCDICGKTFKHRSLLYIHRRIHTDERPHPCKLCTKRFRSTTDLKLHMNIHTGARPFVCSICNKSFMQPGHLRYHILVHTGEHPHRCSLCDKAFTTKHSLIIHVRTHTGEKPYLCQICGKGFADPRVLKKHVSKHEIPAT